MKPSNHSSILNVVLAAIATDVPGQKVEACARSRTTSRQAELVKQQEDSGSAVPRAKPLHFIGPCRTPKTRRPVISAGR
jgi:hypothetical protein